MRKLAFASRWFLASLAIAAVAAPAIGETLRYQFKEGDKMNYVLDNDLQAKIDFNGSAIEFGMKMTFDLDWKVKSVSEDGSAVLEQTVDRLQIAMNSPIQGEFSYDSAASGSEPEGQAWEELGPVLKAMRGGPFEVKVSPTGKVAEIKLPKALDDIFQERGGRRGGPGGRMNLLTSESVKQQIERAFIPLPEGEAKEGETWKQNIENKFGRAGTQKLEITYTLAGMEDKDGKQVAKIDSKSNMTFVPNEEGGGEVDAEIEEQKGSGSVLFNATAGRIVEAKSNQQVVMTMIARDNEITQDFTTVTSLTEGKSKNAPAKEKKDESKEKKD